MPAIYIRSEPNGMTISADTDMTQIHKKQPAPYAVNVLVGLNCVLSAFDAVIDTPPGRHKYVFDHWVVVNAYVPVNNRTITINSWEGEITATAVFLDIPLNENGQGNKIVSHVALGIEGQGTVEPTAPVPYYVGGSLYVKAMSSPNWDFKVFKRNGVEWSGANPAEFLNLQASESIVAVFVETANGNGGDGSGQVPSVNVVAVVGTVAILLGIGYGLYCLFKVKRRRRS